MANKVPKYQELPIIPQTGERHAWGVFGKADQLGTINLLTRQRVVRATDLVRKGRVFNLSLPLDIPRPPLASGRESYQHKAFNIGRSALDDKLDSFYPQSSSHWDALGHIRYRELGFYNGLQEDDIIQNRALGISHWAEHGVVGRGVLFDVPRYMKKKGIPLNPVQDTPFDERLLDDVLKLQAVKLERGDIMLLRTGWMAHYLSCTPEQRALFAGKLSLSEDGMGSPGLKASREVVAFLWDHGVAAVAADNPAVEDSPGSVELGNLHRRVIPLLGLALGELWNFEALAEDCAADNVFECMVVSVPLNLPGGIGSPANAIAIK